MTIRLRPYAVLGFAGAVAAALTLAGCGRKGALDAPPSASLAGDQQAQAAAQQTASPNNGISPIGQFSGGHSPNPRSEGGIDSSGKAIAPKGPDKRIPLDSLLN